MSDFFKKPFVAADHPDDKNFDPIPAGTYPAMIIEHEWKVNNKRTGSYLSLKIQIIGEKHKGRLVWETLNLEHEKESTVDIAQKTLGRLCAAIGVPVIKDENDLLDIPFQVRVKIRAANGNFPAKNEVTGYMPYKGSAPAEPAKTEQQQAQEPASDPAPATDNKKPAWFS